MAFTGIIGQERVINILTKALQKNQISHAYLIEGLEGLGRRRIAHQLSMAIACLKEGGEVPCGTCNSCIKVARRTHPEIKWIQEESSIKVDTIRDLQREIQMKPYQGSKKVFIVTDVEKMTIQAQNAFLKTLEEPPEDSCIILTTVNSGSLLPTILSRCQILKLYPVQLDTIQKYLLENESISFEESKVIASFSKGVIGKALKLIHDEEFKNKREKIEKISKILLKEGLVETMELSEFFIQNSKDNNEALDLLMNWYRDLLIYKETKVLDFIMNYDKIEEIHQQAKAVPSDKLREIIDIIEDAKNKARSNVNPQLNMEVMLLKIQEVLSW